jgi:hypothetical protein
LIGVGGHSFQCFESVPAWRFDQLIEQGSGADEGRAVFGSRIEVPQSRAGLARRSFSEGGFFGALHPFFVVKHAQQRRSPRRCYDKLSVD